MPPKLGSLEIFGDVISVTMCLFYFLKEGKPLAYA
jgi:hypothetical protein